ncbi:MAG: helix-turn-helix transcriptional regulator [Tepidisphaeraceae bacterium]
MGTNLSADGLLPPDAQRRRLVLFLAQNVAELRQKAGLTQLQLAVAADLSRATVHLIEAGACDPRLSTVTSLADALGRNALSLFADPRAQAGLDPL